MRVLFRPASCLLKTSLVPQQCQKCSKVDVQFLMIFCAGSSLIFLPFLTLLSGFREPCQLQVETVSCSAQSSWPPREQQPNSQFFGGSPHTQNNRVHNLFDFYSVPQVCGTPPPPKKKKKNSWTHQIFLPATVISTQPSSQVLTRFPHW